MNILAFFTNNGVPATGLSPTIRIRDVSDNSLLVTDSAMTEIGDGSYKYDFTTYDKDVDYSIRCDGGALLPTAERYTYGGNENYIDDISESITENTSGGFGTLDTKIDSLSASNQDNFNTVNNNILLIPSATSSEVWSASADSFEKEGTMGELQNKTAYLGSVYIDTINGFSGTGDQIGTPFRPSNNIQDAKTIADRIGLRSYVVTGTIVLHEAHTYWDFKGIGSDQIVSIVNLNGFDVTGSQFTETSLTGAQNGPVNTWRCGLFNLTNAYGAYHHSVIQGFIKPANNRDVFLLGNWSGVAGLDTPSIDFINAPSGATVSLRQYSGGIEIKNMNSPNHIMSAEYVAGQFKILDSNNNTNGTIAVRGVTKITKGNSVGTTIIEEAALARTSITESIWNASATLYNVSGSMGELQNLIAANNASLKRVLGLVHENIFIDQPNYDSDGNLTSARLRIYSNPASVGTTNDVIGTYQISAPSTAPGQFTTWSQVRSS